MQFVIQSTSLRIVLFLTAIIVNCLNSQVFADKLDDLGLNKNGKLKKIQRIVDNDQALVFFTHHDHVVSVKRNFAFSDRKTSKNNQIEIIINTLLQGPNQQEQAQGLTSPFPNESKLIDLVIDDKNILLTLLLSDNFFQDPVRESSIELMNRSLQQSLIPFDVEKLVIKTINPVTQEVQPLEHFLPKDHYAEFSLEPDTATVKKKPSISSKQQETHQAYNELKMMPTYGSDRPVGSLSNKVVGLNPGHGWTWRDFNPERWGLQRTFVENNIEDFSNVDTINQWLAAYAYNAGADVFSTREMDPQPYMVIVDNDDGEPNYIETGDGWFNSSLDGFSSGMTSYVNGEDPFSFGTNRLIQCVVGEATASATWIANIPKDGWYYVYVSHAAFSNRSPEAHYQIYHAGGVTDYYLNQLRYRFTWVPVGRYFFEAGSPENERKVMLFNDSSSSEHYISADAVRFGGGMGVISRGTIGTSNKPRYDEEARYHIQFSGSPDYDGASSDEADGWPRRPRHLRWLKQQGEIYAPPQDWVAVSSHTNAFNGSVDGLNTYLHDNAEQGDNWHKRFRDHVHDEVLHDLMDGYPGTYGPHGQTGKKYGGYAEANPNNVSNLMPILLGEWLFHDNPDEMAMYHDPIFRKMMARAIYQGIVKFWAAENDSPSTLLPEPPQFIRIEQLTTTSARISWEDPITDNNDFAGDSATGYKLYRGTHGRGFPPGVDIGNVNDIVINDLTPDTTHYFYVTATNEGGESFPSETVSVRTTNNGQDPKILIINGYDKLDIATHQSIPWGNDEDLYRHIIHKMNTTDYIVEFSKAIDNATDSYAFDTAEAETIDQGFIDLMSYDGIIWIGGIESEASTIDMNTDTSITDIQQTKLNDFLNSGNGRLFISGAEIAWDLDRNNEITFVDQTLKANYQADNGQSNMALGSPDSIFEILDPVLFGVAPDSLYHVRYPDAITPLENAQEAMQYVDMIIIDPLEEVDSWWDPNASGQTNADAASSFKFVTTPSKQGNGAADLYYVWGGGDFIREYNSTKPPFPVDTTFSIWVYGDGSEHRVRIAVRDSDNDIFTNEYTIVDFSNEWQEITWNALLDPVNVWFQGGNGIVDGPELELDSIHVQRNENGPNPDSGHLYFDDINGGVASEGNGQVAAIQYAEDYRLVYFGFPFETINDETLRFEVMDETLKFLFADFDPSTPDIFADGFENN